MYRAAPLEFIKQSFSLFRLLNLAPMIGRSEYPAEYYADF